MKKWLILLLVAGCKTQPPLPPIAVEVQIVEVRDVPITVQAIGNVFGFQTIEIRPQVTGQIMQAHVNEGDWVDKGDLLFTIDQSSYKAALDKAKATLEKDKALLDINKIKLERNEELVKKEYISKVVYDELKSNVEAQLAQVNFDKAEVQAAQINLERTQIKAFSSGKIGRFNYDPGNIVSPSDQNPLTTLQYIDQVYINFALPEKDFEKISATQKSRPIEFDVLLDNDKQIGKGEVAFIDNRINPETGTFLLRGLASNPQKLMWPGQFVRVRLILETLHQATLVPQKAIQSSQKGPLLWLINPDMTVKSLPVKLGEKINSWVVVTTPLETQKVVTLGQENLTEGAKVFIPEK